MRYQFLGNITRDSEGEVVPRPAYCRFPDTAEQAVLPTDQLVVVYEGSVAVGPAQRDVSAKWSPLAELLDAAETVFALMNSDSRPTGQYFRSMCVGDVVLFPEAEVALAALSFGFAVLADCPAPVSGLSELELLAAFRTGSLA
jgi:hypothetical protein